MYTIDRVNAMLAALNLPSCATLAAFKDDPRRSTLSYGVAKLEEVLRLPPPWKDANTRKTMGERIASIEEHM